MLRQVINIQKISDLISFEESGHSVVKHFPVTGVIGYAIVKRYHEQISPQSLPFNIDRFKSSL